MDKEKKPATVAIVRAVFFMTILRVFHPIHSCQPVQCSIRTINVNYVSIQLIIKSKQYSITITISTRRLSYGTVLARLGISYMNVWQAIRIRERIRADVGFESNRLHSLKIKKTTLAIQVSDVFDCESIKSYYKRNHAALVSSQSSYTMSVF